MEHPQFTWMGKPETEMSRQELIDVIIMQNRMIKSMRKQHTEDVERWMNTALDIARG